MVILGLNCFHGDSSACLVIDGQVSAAVEEERFVRIKHWAGFPTLSIRYCLSQTDLSLSDVDVVAINSDPRANIGKKLRFLLQSKPDLDMVIGRLRSIGQRLGLGEELERMYPHDRFRAEVRHVEHHMSHLASAFFAAPFEDAAVVSVDGFGDFSSAAWGTGHDNTISVTDGVSFPHSLGIFYQALTQFLGFCHYGDEYKVMGLAPYGEPRYLDKMRQIVLRDTRGVFSLNLEYFRHHREKISYAWDGEAPRVDTLYAPQLEELLGPARRNGDELTQHHYDIASSIQAMYEEAFFSLLEHVHGTLRSDRLALAGGCAMNSVANGKVLQRSPFRRLYVPAAAGDAGGAVGAALVVWHETQPVGPKPPTPYGYLGPSFSNAEIAAVIDRHRAELDSNRCTVSTEQDAPLCQRVARMIAEGRVVGWFQGRLEWGPRALGNRSILGDPRRKDMKDLLNLKIKRRESFRPFAPSILRERVSEWFETDDDVPFMSSVFMIQSAQRERLPAVAHVDGSGRLQTVSTSDNPLYYRLISAFDELTGVPMLLNTSFNENEPVVCRPEEALNCFLRTQMDVLVMGPYILERSWQP